MSFGKLAREIEMKNSSEILKSDDQKNDNIIWNEGENDLKDRARPLLHSGTRNIMHKKASRLESMQEKKFRWMH